jgi:hypothetical protein
MNERDAHAESGAVLPRCVRAGRPTAPTLRRFT